MFSFILQGAQAIAGGILSSAAKRAAAKQVLANAAYQSGQYMMNAERAGNYTTTQTLNADLGEKVDLDGGRAVLGESARLTLTGEGGNARASA